MAAPWEMLRHSQEGSVCERDHASLLHADQAHFLPAPVEPIRYAVLVLFCIFAIHDTIDVISFHFFVVVMQDSFASPPDGIVEGK
jgi:hypothetical protein